MNLLAVRGHLASDPMAIPFVLRLRVPSFPIMPSPLRAAETKKHGDAELLRLAYAESHEAVRAFARRLVGDADAAEDLVQETFVSLPGAVARAEPSTPLRALLFGICANHARHHVRAAARRRAALGRLEQQPPSSRDGREGPESRASRSELIEALQRALDRLTHDHRVVVVLCDVEELTSREVASILGIPEGTVKTRLFHARRNLRAAFEGEET